MKNIIKYGLAASMMAASTIGAFAQAVLPGNPYVVVSTAWTNRLAGGTSATNNLFIDITGLKNITVELQQQNVANTPNGGLALYLGKSNGYISDYANSSTNLIDYFSYISNSVGQNALITTVVHTNFTVNSSGNQCPIGYRFLVLGPLTNCCGTAASYATNYKVLVYGN